MEEQARVPKLAFGSLDAQNIDVGGQTEKRAPKELSGKKFT